MTYSMGPGKLVCHMRNPLYTYDEYLICIRLGPSISAVICKNPSTVVRHIQVHLYYLFLLTLLLSVSGACIIQSEPSVSVQQPCLSPGLQRTYVVRFSSSIASLEFCSGVSCLLIEIWSPQPSFITTVWNFVLMSVAD